MLLIGVIVGFVGAHFYVTMTPSVPRPSNTNTADDNNQPEATGASAAAYAAEVGIEDGDLNTCLSSKRHGARIDADLASGSAAGVQGTPGNIIYNTKTGKAVALPGAVPFEMFKAEIDKMLGIDKTPSTSGEATNVAPIDASKDHIRGNENAQVAVIEYSDFQCPYCARVHPTIKQVLDTYGDKVMWVYRQFPLPATLHPLARNAAEVSECVAELGGNDAFWQYADLVFEKGLR
jgi:protein-disulfide isomerase